MIIKWSNLVSEVQPLFSVKKTGLQMIAKKEVARPERFELPTNWFEASYSIQLSYRRL